MLQYLGQGACQALEDADALAERAPKNRGVDAVDRDDTLSGFVEQRTSRTAVVQTNARTRGEIWHADGVGRLMRNELFTRRDPGDYRHIDWFYAN